MASPVALCEPGTMVVILTTGPSSGLRREQAVPSILNDRRWGPLALVLAGLALVAFVAPSRPVFVDGLTYSFKLAVEASAYLWAAQRAELPTRVRGILRAFGLISACAIPYTGLQVAAAYGLVSGVDGYIMVYGTTTYAIWFALLLRYPGEPVLPPRRWGVILDLVLGSVPLAVMQWLILRHWSTLPLGRLERVNNVVYGISQIAVMVGLSRAMSIGRPVPSVRAYVLWMAGLSTYVPTVVFGQLESVTGSSMAKGLSEGSYFLGVVFVVLAARHIRHDPIDPAGAAHRRPWSIGVNPVSALMPALVGVALVVVVSSQRSALTLPLALTLVVATLLLVARLVVSAIEVERLRRERQGVEEQIRAHREAARAEEREVMLNDIHDGVGSNLTTAMFLLRTRDMPTARAAEVLQECLDDIRIFVDTLSNQDGSLVNALADFRHRLHERLGPGSPALEWQVALEDMPPLSGETLLHLMRFLQEAITNALRHARATCIRVVVSRDAEVLSLRVYDDGVGLGGARKGQGLKNMHRRTLRMGGEFGVGAPADGVGTEVCFRVPLCALAGNASRSA